MRYLLLTILTLILSCQPKNKTNNKNSQELSELLSGQNRSFDDELILAETKQIEHLNYSVFDSVPAFKLGRYKPGEPKISKTISISSNPLDSKGAPQDMMGDQKAVQLNGRNILELYQFAYEDLPSDSLICNSLDSTLLIQLYNLFFSYTSKEGDFNTILIEHLNNALGLRTYEASEIIDVIVLEAIDTSKKQFRESSNQTLSNSTTGGYAMGITIEGTGIDLARIIDVLEDVFKMPVKTEIDSEIKYDANVSIHERNLNTDDWLHLLKEKGLVLRKDKEKTIKSVFIDKASK